jgi:hypothetical protein
MGYSFPVKGDRTVTKKEKSVGCLSTHSAGELIKASWIFAIVLIALHMGMFFGDTLFTEEDHLSTFLWQAGNANSNGWRPDIALGLTCFYGDPGAFHCWSVYRWFHELFSDDRMVFQVTILFLLWLTSITQFLFLTKAIPSLRFRYRVGLSLLIPLGSLRYEFFFQRHWTFMTISPPVIALILHEFFQRPSLRHYFYYTLTLFFSLFLGSFLPFFHSLWFSLVFALAYFYYYHLKERKQETWNFVKRFFYLNAGAGISIPILGAWIFYSLFIEHSTVGYVRDPDYSTNSWFVSFDAISIFNKFLSYVSVALLPANVGGLGFGQYFSLLSWNYVSPIIPILLLPFLFSRSQNFWEFISKVIIFGGFFWQEITSWVPGIVNVFQRIFNLYPPTKLQPIIQVFEVLLLGIFIDRFQREGHWKKIFGMKIVRIFGAILLTLYGVLSLFVACAMFFPQQLKNFLSGLLDWSGVMDSLGAKGKFIEYIGLENITLFNETFSFYFLLYCLSCLPLIWFFIAKPRFGLFENGREKVFMVLLLFNSVALCWGGVPLNKDPLVWDHILDEEKQISEQFSSVDRIVRVSPPPCRGRSGFLECVERKFFDLEFGPDRNVIGYRMSPILDFSTAKSFTSREVTEFVQALLRMENIEEKGLIRYLTTSPPILSSRIYDIYGITYLQSRYRLPTMENMELVYKAKQFFLYKNKRAWPYYYFADRIEAIHAYEDLYDAEQGVAYLWEDDPRIDLIPNLTEGKRRLELTKFEYGDVEFMYSSEEQEFLVIADSWHPNWHASVNEKEVPIVKTNGVFKGVLLPSGEGVVRLFFDNSPYQPGIWISVISWILFLFGWVWYTLRSHEKCLAD